MTEDELYNSDKTTLKYYKQQAIDAVLKEDMKLSLNGNVLEGHSSPLEKVAQYMKAYKESADIPKENIWSMDASPYLTSQQAADIVTGKDLTWKLNGEVLEGSSKPLSKKDFDNLQDKQDKIWKEKSSNAPSFKYANYPSYQANPHDFKPVPYEAMTFKVKSEYTCYYCHAPLYFGIDHCQKCGNHDWDRIQKGIFKKWSKKEQNQPSSTLAWSGSAKSF